MTDFELTLDERQDRILEILAEGVLALISRSTATTIRVLVERWKLTWCQTSPISDEALIASGVAIRKACGEIESNF